MLWLGVWADLPCVPTGASTFILPWLVGKCHADLHLLRALSTSFRKAGEVELVMQIFNID